MNRCLGLRCTRPTVSGLQSFAGMNRPDIRSAHVLAVLLVSLVGCGGDERGLFQANLESGGEESFPEFVTRLDGTDPLILLTCSKDPTPQVADDEISLCLRVYLDAASLSGAGAPATLPIAGEARLAEAISSTPATFTAAPGHSPVITTSWATVGCYAPRREGPFVQQLQGRLELSKNTAERLSGRLVLTAEGQLDVADCGKATSANFDFSFDVARP
jgi:hypothetical protein